MEELIALFGELKGAVDTAKEALDGLGAAAKAVWDGLTQGVTVAKEAMEGAALAVPKIIDTMAAPIEEVGKTFKEMAGTLAGTVRQTFGALTDGIAMMASAVGPFVAALNPSLIQNYQLAFRDLQATIGVALQPAMQSLASFTREIAGRILPAMRALAPVIENISVGFKNVLGPVISAIADLIADLAPVLEFLAGIFRSIGEAIGVFITVWRALIQTIVGMLGGGDLKGAMEGFRNALQQIVKALLGVVAFIAREFGATGFLDNLIKSLHTEAKPAAGVKAAPTNVGISGFENITKELSVAAFSAQGGAGADNKTERDYLADLAKMVTEIKEGKTFEQFLQEILKNLPDKVKFGILGAWEAIKDFFKSPTGEAIVQGAKETAATAAGVASTGTVGISAAPSIFGAGLALPASLLGG